MEVVCGSCRNTLPPVIYFSNRKAGKIGHIWTQLNLKEVIGVQINALLEDPSLQGRNTV
jgi:hypothetical protein